jgi:predicted nucleic acid-binding protein
VLVVDATVAFRACRRGRFDGLDEDLIAPPLMWSETRSTIRLAVWRGELSEEQGRNALERLEAAPVARRQPARLGFEAWAIAEELGWARTYDAEYLALARLSGCRVVTGDRRLRRGAERTGLVIGLDAVLGG